MTNSGNSMWSHDQSWFGSVSRLAHLTTGFQDLYEVDLKTFRNVQHRLYFKATKIYGLFQIVEFILSSCHHSLVTISSTRENSKNVTFSTKKAYDDHCSVVNSSYQLEGGISLQGSIINPNGFSQTDFFYLRRIKFILDISVIAFSVLLFLGLQKGQRQLLIPWIIVNVCLVTADIVEIVILLSLRTTKFEPSTAFVFTISFFLLFLHIYAILGVIAQYQEFVKGRTYDSMREDIPEIGRSTIVMIDTDFTPTMIKDSHSNGGEQKAEEVKNSRTKSLPRSVEKKVQFHSQEDLLAQKSEPKSLMSKTKSSSRITSSPVRKISSGKQQRQKLKSAEIPEETSSKKKIMNTSL